MNALRVYQTTMDRMIQAIEGYEVPDELIDGEDEFELARLVRMAREEQ